MVDSFVIFQKHATKLALNCRDQGTTLKELFGVDTSQSPLWCAQSILEDSRMIVETHLAFLRAGAQIILTST